MSRLSDQAARRRLALNPITTSLSASQHHQPHQTPASAVSNNSFSGQFAYQPSTYTPISAVRQYNPQQWTPPPSGITEHVHPSQQFALRQSHDPEVVVPAPPPYSPPRSAVDDHSSGRSPAIRISPLQAYRSSPEPSSNAVFQAPPPPRTRAVNERPQSFFSSLTRRSAHAPEVPFLSADTIREHTPHALSLQPPTNVPEPLHPEEYNSTGLDQRAPAARRAASASAISTPTSSRSRASSTSRWENGMPLPPPPPGPPPSSRSQSSSRVMTTDHFRSPATRRPGATMGSSLGPIPPTPFGYFPDDVRANSPNKGLVIDTTSVVSSSTTCPESITASTSSGLTRQPAVKGETKSIRERRSESKSGKRIAEDNSNNPWVEAITPSDTAPPLTILGRRPAVPTSAPRSAKSLNVETPKSADMSSQSTPTATPRFPAPTPPFSPNQTQSASQNRSTFGAAGSPAIPPKGLPTPPLQPRATLESPARPSKPQSYQPVSSETQAVMQPKSRSSSRPASRQSMSDQLPISPAEQFSRNAIERHQAFAQREALATSDAERVRIFAEFIVAESRLRRERYASAIDKMGSEILELTRDLFKPYGSSRRESTVSRDSGWTPDSSAHPGSRSHRSSILASSQLDIPQLQMSTPEHQSSSGQASPALPTGDSAWYNNYKPSLSPIASINTASVSEALEEGDSRGRPSSRWWEVSDKGSQEESSLRLERSKRESKYMGVPKELREKLQFSSDDIANANSIAGPSRKSVTLGPNEYPPEKTGPLEQDLISPLASARTTRSAGAFSPAPFTPNPEHLDVSRLVTLPPPYPRHHPAVNNNHPDLTSIRTTVRALSDLTEVEATKSRFTLNSTRLRTEAAAAAAQRKSSLRVSISREIESGNITYAEAADFERNAEIKEAEKVKEASKADFALFQEQVVGPLNQLLMERIDRATAFFEQLKSQLKVEAQQHDPNSTQEEGDEQPELLEKLNLLRWIFEARELLHREVYELLSDRNDRYRDMVVAPYRLSGNTAKVESSLKFFAADGLQRKLQDEQEILKRTEDFIDVIEKNVRDGVEALLNAFWDIAPDLSRITSQIPFQLHGFQIQIPASEYEENPAYFEFPMQYLYSLLGHCEKSTYQFIESQTNLLCLLHEVKSLVTAANCRLMRTQRVVQGESEEEVERELKAVEMDEEGRLTDDLKEKVRCVEELWSSGLGTELKGVKERLVVFLVDQGGWADDD